MQRRAVLPYNLRVAFGEVPRPEKHRRPCVLDLTRRGLVANSFVGPPPPPVGPPARYPPWLLRERYPGGWMEAPYVYCEKLLVMWP